MENSIITLAIGFLAQGFFSARVLVQWILSERARHVLSPSLFWVFSLIGAYLLCIYGWLRGDFAIVLGQFLTYYVYLWNLNAKGIWHRLHLLLRLVLVVTPVVALVLASENIAEVTDNFLHNDKVPLWLLIYGSAGQVLFTFRFVYQWLYSRKKGESTLPAGFWIISLTGSLCIVTYGLIRHDIVLIIGQSFGVFSYARNLILLRNEKKSKEKESAESL